MLASGTILPSAIMYRIRSALGTLALLILASPAQGQIASRYVGKVENALVPTAPTRLELSIFVPTDTLSVGWLQIAPPLGGSGLAVVVEHPDSIVIVSLSTLGDTIRWHAKNTPPRLTGRYDILGGQYRGQSGTWTLTSQPEPSRSLLLVGVCALGLGATILLLMMAIRGQVGWWDWRRRHGPHIADADIATLTGIKGWLAWHLLGVAGVSIYLIVTASEIGDSIGRGTWMLQALVPNIRWVLVFESAGHVFQLSALVVGFFLAIRRQPATAPFMAFTLIALAIYGIADIVSASGMADALAAGFGSSVADEARKSIAAAETTNTRLAVNGAIWTLYWLRSRRVFLTFGPRATIEQAEASMSATAIARIAYEGTDSFSAS